MVSLQAILRNKFEQHWVNLGMGRSSFCKCFVPCSAIGKKDLMIAMGSPDPIPSPSDSGLLDPLSFSCHPVQLLDAVAVAPEVAVNDGDLVTELFYGTIPEFNILHHNNAGFVCDVPDRPVKLL